MERSVRRDPWIHILVGRKMGKISVRKQCDCSYNNNVCRSFLREGIHSAQRWDGHRKDHRYWGISNSGFQGWAGADRLHGVRVGVVKKGLSFWLTVSNIRLKQDSGLVVKWGPDSRGPACPAVQLWPQEFWSRRVTGWIAHVGWPWQYFIQDKRYISSNLWCHPLFCFT